MDLLTELVGSQTRPQAEHRSEGTVESFVAHIAEAHSEP